MYTSRCKLWGILLLDIFERLSHCGQLAIQHQLSILRPNIVEASPDEAHETMQKLAVFALHGPVYSRLLSISPFGKVCQVLCLNRRSRPITSQLADEDVLVSISVPETLNIDLCCS